MSPRRRAFVPLRCCAVSRRGGASAASLPERPTAFKSPCRDRLSIRAWIRPPRPASRSAEGRRFTPVLPSGLRVTSVARTLIDLAEELSADELREAFAAARDRGLLDMEAVHRSRARVEWRPSLAMLDTVIAEFEDT
jgi:hypothetical protein